VQSTYEVLAPPGVSSYARFQLARFAERLEGEGAVERYRLTRGALLAAIERGATAEDVIAFLERHAHARPGSAEGASAALPPAVLYSLREWGGKAEQVRVSHAVLLGTDDPVIMAQLKAGKFGEAGGVEQLGPGLLRLPEGEADALVSRLRAADIGVRDERVDLQLPIGERDLCAVVEAAAVYARMCAELGWESEVTPAMLQRLLRLVPRRVADAALAAAERAAAEIKRVRE
jgi:Helicase conserved C-terminal domain